MDFKNIFNRLIMENGLPAADAEKFEKLYNLLLKGNDVLNLTALTSVEDVIVRHFADCLRVAGFMPDNGRVIDVGCGGGFPSLPLAIARPDIEIFALDATEKKICFVRECAKILGLSNLNAVCGRAEILAHSDLRQSFDIAVSRAVARLNILAELCIPFVRPGGGFIAMKGAAAAEEVDEAQQGISELGGQLVSWDNFELSDGSARNNLIIAKMTDTPQKYPRSYARIKKNPLGI